MECLRRRYFIKICRRRHHGSVATTFLACRPRKTILTLACAGDITVSGWQKPGKGHQSAPPARSTELNPIAITCISKHTSAIAGRQLQATKWANRHKHRLCGRRHQRRRHRLSKTERKGWTWNHPQHLGGGGMAGVRLAEN